MKSPIVLVLVLLMALTGCGAAGSQHSESASAGYHHDNTTTPEALVAQVEPEAARPRTKTAARTETATHAPAEFQQISLTNADTAAAAAEAADRKIIRNANLTMEVESTTDSQHKVTSIAESHGGFVVTSEARQRENSEPAKRTLDIMLVVRVPAGRFGPALDQIRGLATNLREENVTGQDVTEEFIDLEARLKTQKALEFSFSKS